jgi:hypothetical protein
VQGDVWQTLCVPILNFRPWTDALNDTPIGILYIEQMSQISGSPALSSPVVYCNIFRAGGEDMQFAFPQDPALWAFRKAINTWSGTEEDMRDAKLQMNIRDKFNEQFDPLVKSQFFIEEKNAVMAETVEAMIDLMKRHTVYTGATSIIGNTTYLSFHKFIAYSFMWQRGGLIYRHLHTDTANGGRTGWGMTDTTAGHLRYDLGWAPAYSASTAIPQIEAIAVPYISATHYQVTIGSGGYVLGSSQRAVQKRPILNVATPGDVTIAAGDDFVFLFQVPWARILFDPPAPTKHSAAYTQLKKALN